jgi:hypothetical protein
VFAIEVVMNVPCVTAARASLSHLSPQCVQRTRATQVILRTVFYGIGLTVASRPQLVTRPLKAQAVPPNTVNTSQLSTKSPRPLLRRLPGTTYLLPSLCLLSNQVRHLHRFLPRRHTCIAVLAGAVFTRRCIDYYGPSNASHKHSPRPPTLPGPLSSVRNSNISTRQS